MVAHIFNPSTRETEADDLCEFKATLVHMRLNLSKREIVYLKVIPGLGSHAFNFSTKEVETGVLWLGGGRNIRQEETGVQM